MFPSSPPSVYITAVTSSPTHKYKHLVLCQPGAREVRDLASAWWDSKLLGIRKIIFHCKQVYHEGGRGWSLGWGEAATGIRWPQKLVLQGTLGLVNEKVPPGTWNHTAQSRENGRGKAGKGRNLPCVAGTPEIQENSELHGD